MRSLNRLHTIYRHHGLAGVLWRLKRKFFSEGDISSEIDFLKAQQPSGDELTEYSEVSRKLSYRPKISVIMPVFKPQPQFLREAISSVQDQVYENWELCIADDDSSCEAVRKILEQAKVSDERIRITFREKRGHISACSNSALELATGEYILLFDHDDLLPPHCLVELVQTLQDDVKPDFVFTNEDKVDSSGALSEPTCKPGWSPYLFRSHMYVGHVALYRTVLVRELGGFREGLEGSQDYDLVLRAIENGAQVKHLPKFLYHWRKHSGSVAEKVESKRYAFESAKKALRESIERVEDRPVLVEDGLHPGVYRVRYPVQELTQVELISWGRGDGTLDHAGDNIEVSPRYLSEDEVVQKESLREALSGSKAAFVVFLHRSLTAHHSGWATPLIEPLSTKGVAASAGRILSSDGSQILQAGLIVEQGTIVSQFSGSSAYDPGYSLRLFTGGEVSALSLLCLAVERSVLLEALSEIEESLSLHAFQIALSFLLKRRGALVWTPYSSFRSTAETLCEKSYLIDDLGEDGITLNRHFGLQSYTDPYYPLGLNRKEFDYSLHVT